MPTTAELIRKQDELLSKARSHHRLELKKIEESELKRLSKILKLTDYFECEFSDKELFNGLKHMVHLKQTTSSLLNEEAFPQAKKKTIRNNSQQGGET